jgi:hypothetical protein
MEIVSPRLLRPKPADNRLECEFFDCSTRFLVRSESRKNEVHLVDLDSEDRGRFECSCEDWHFRNPDWVIAPVPYQCKHIHRAKQFIFELAEVIRKEDARKERFRNAPDI